MKKFYRTVECLDQFGLPVSLFFKEDMLKRKSIVGAVFTIIMFIAIITLMIASLDKIGNPYLQNITINEFQKSLEDQPLKHIRDTRFRFFHVIKSMSDQGFIEPEISRNIDRYINMTYFQAEEDWN